MSEYVFTSAKVEFAPYSWGMKIRWAAEDIGFGEVQFIGWPGVLIIDSEAMDKEFVKALLAYVIDKAEEAKP